MSYYENYWDSPLYNPSRKERNLVDLCRVTFLRAKSKYAPHFSFDIATVDKEFTLTADSDEAMQVWLRLLGRCVDCDACIVPDDSFDFKVKTKVDPLRHLDDFDYSTLLQFSPWGNNLYLPSLT